MTIIWPQVSGGLGLIGGQPNGKDESVSARNRCCLTLLLLPLALACTPTVRVQAPTEPITINLNVRLDADVRVRLEERAPQTVQANPGIF